jgi:hypothetical protein
MTKVILDLLPLGLCECFCLLHSIPYKKPLRSPFPSVLYAFAPLHFSSHTNTYAPDYYALHQSYPKLKGQLGNKDNLEVANRSIVSGVCLMKATRGFHEEDFIITLAPDGV